MSDEFTTSTPPAKARGLSISSSGVRLHALPIRAGKFGGSASFYLSEDGCLERKQRRAAAPADSKSGGQGAAAPATPANGSAAAKPPRRYKVNAAKVRAKSFALFQTERGRKFMAFYSISFPCGLPDGEALRIFNIWLTRCREVFDLSAYLWVSERQGNGTIHYHLLTTTRMPISRTNSFIKAALLRSPALSDEQRAATRSYNGVDVDNVYFSKRHAACGCRRRRQRAHAAAYITRYLTKYISKSDATFEHLAWHCSREVSALFTCEYYGELEETNFIRKFFASRSDWSEWSSEYCKIYRHRDYPNLLDFTDIGELNDAVLSQFQI